MRKLLVFQHAPSEPPLGVRVLDQTRTHVAPSLKLSERVFHQFLGLFEWRRPALRLASR